MKQYAWWLFGYGSAVLCAVTALAAPHAFRAFTLAGMPFAGPTNSDCQPYPANNGNAVALNCPIQFIKVTAVGPHPIQQNEWSSVLVASGGGTVQFVLPTATPNGRNAVSFATDGNTGFSISAQAPTVMQGSPLIVNGTLTAGPNSDGWAGLSGNVWQVNVR